MFRYTLGFLGVPILSYILPVSVRLLCVWKVAKVDGCRQRLASYGSEGIWPLYSAVDPDTSHVLVADTDNHRILLLDRHLRLRRVLLTGGLGGGEDGLEKPWRLCYEHRSGRLFVGMPRRKINVYRVRWIFLAAAVICSSSSSSSCIITWFIRCWQNAAKYNHEVGLMYIK